jgi:hypothetical protein
MITNLSPNTKIPSRFTVKKDIQTEFKEKKTQLKYELSLIDNKIALTTDIWTSMSNGPIPQLQLILLIQTKSYLMFFWTFATFHTLTVENKSKIQ